MNHALLDLRQLGARIAALPPGMRCWCLPTELGLVVHVAAAVDGRHIAAQRLVSWIVWGTLEGVNPLVVAFEQAIAQVEREMTADLRGVQA